MKKEIGQLVKHSGIYGLGVVLSKSVGFFLIPMYAHFLSPRDYGTLELLDMLTFFTTNFAALGIYGAVFRFYAAYDSDQDKKAVVTTALFYAAVACSLFAFILFYWAPLLGYLILGKASFAPYIRIVALTFFFSGLTEVPLAYWRAQGRSALFVGVGLAKTITGASALILFLAILKLGIMGALYANLLVNGVWGLALFGIVLAALPWRMGKQKLVEMLRYGLPTVAWGISAFILTYSDRLFLRYYATLSEVGVYALGYKLAAIVAIAVNVPFNMAWQWQQFEIAKRENAKHVFSKVGTYLLIVTVFAALGVSILAPDVLRIMTPPAYWGAAHIVPLIALSYVLTGVQSVVSTSIYVQYKTVWVGIIGVITAALTLVLNNLLISRYHSMGAAVATILSYGIQLFLVFLAAQRVYKVRYEYMRSTILLGSAILFYLVGARVRLGLAGSVGIHLLLCLLFVALAFVVLDQQEREMLQQWGRTAVQMLRRGAEAGKMLWAADDLGLVEAGPRGEQPEDATDVGRLNVPPSSTGSFQSCDDAFRSFWVNLLVDLKDKNILKVGTRRPSHIYFLSQQGCKQITCIGPINDNLQRLAVTWRRSVEEVPSGSQDVAVFDERESFDSLRSKAQFRATIGKIVDALNPGGVLLLCLPQGLNRLRFRYWLAEVIALGKFDLHRYYFGVTPGRCPSRLISYSESPAWATTYLSQYEKTAAPSPWTMVKQVVKRAVYPILRTYNPRVALVVVARKPAGQEHEGTLGLGDKVKNLLFPERQHDESLGLVLSTRPYDGGQTVFVHDSRTSQLLAIARASPDANDPSDLSRRRFENLTLLSSLAGTLSEKGVAVPELVYADVFGPMTLYIQRGLKGTQLMELVDRSLWHDDRASLVRLVNSALDIQIFIQDRLTRHLGSRARKIDACYFENYLNLPLGNYPASSERPRGGVQHGDFAPINILYDRSQKRWGVVDWEWMYAGYPPLFDVFSFLCPVGLTANQRRRAGPHAQGMGPFINTFFGETWFSGIMRERVARYCDNFEIPRQHVYWFFLSYLLFQCGKYRRVIVSLPEFLSAYEERLKYSVSHRERFVFA